MELAAAMTAATAAEAQRSVVVSRMVAASHRAAASRMAVVAPPEQSVSLQPVLEQRPAVASHMAAES